MPRRLPEEELEARVVKVDECLAEGFTPPSVLGNAPGAVSEAARRLGINRQALRASLEAAEDRLGIIPNWDLWKPEARHGVSTAPREAQAVIDDRRLRDEIARTRSERDALARKLAAAEDFQSLVLDITQRDRRPPKWTGGAKARSSHAQTPILFASDWQWGEFVVRDHMGGINEFNREVGARRVRRLVDTTIDLAFEHMTKPSYDKLVYLRGGDAISGMIHEELDATNDRTPVEAVCDLLDLEAAALRRLADAFGRVEVYSVPGNHGRPRQQKRSKNYVRDNLETIVSWTLEREFIADDRVHFHTPLSGDALFKVYGWQCLLTHGDRTGTGGGQGFVGPVAPIARGMKKLVDYYAKLGVVLDYIFMGHYHTPLELEYGWSNGSLPGASEYSLAGRMRPAVPSQWLIFFHPKWGPTARWDVRLEDSLGTVDRG